LWGDYIDLKRLLSILVFAIALAQSDPASEGLKAFRDRNFVKAQDIFLQLVQREPRNARFWKLLGMSYAAEEKYDLAEAGFEKACTLNPREESACYYLARTEFTLARLEKSLQHYQIALQFAGANRGRVLLGIALAEEASGRAVEAERYFVEAIKTGEKQARVDYGMFLFKQGRGRESLEELEKAGAKAEADRVRSALAAVPSREINGTVNQSVSFESKPLNMVVRNGATGEKHLIETMIAGVAVFDYDNDGWPDIYVANGATVPGLIKNDSSYFNRLFRNNHDGTFADVTGKAGVAGYGYSMGVAVADYDNDGYDDLFVTGVQGNTLFHNRGDGTFEDVTATSGLANDNRWSVAAGWFDFDNDGLLDLFVVRYVEWDPAKEIYCGLVRTGFRQYCNPSEYLPLPNALYKNLGGGKFKDISVQSGISAKLGKGMGVGFGDSDNDGKLDIFVANDTMPNFLFHNDGSGKFHDVALDAGVAYNADGKPLSSMGVDFRDYDNDGREDLFVTALSNETFPLFRNLGNGHFADLTYPSGIGKASMPWTGWSTGMFDFNNDGWKDIFVAGGHVMDNAELSSSRKSRQPNLIFLNRGSGQFDAQLLAGEALHRGAAFGDFDRDGRIDVVVTRLNESPQMLHNTSAAGNWLELRLVGHTSNRDAIGAKVHLVTASGEQWNRVTTSVGYGCSSDRVVHFGVGPDRVVVLLEIYWPSGKLQKLNNIAVNQLRTVDEP
jgi:tetratricopeptide (TPR) repeat protein